MSLIELVRPCEAVAIGYVSAGNTSGQVSIGASKRGSIRLLIETAGRGCACGQIEKDLESVEGGSNRCRGCQSQPGRSREGSPFRVRWGNGEERARRFEAIG